VVLSSSKLLPTFRRNLLLIVFRVKDCLTLKMNAALPSKIWQMQWAFLSFVSLDTSSESGRRRCCIANDEATLLQSSVRRRIIPSVFAIWHCLTFKNNWIFKAGRVTFCSSVQNDSCFRLSEYWTRNFISLYVGCPENIQPFWISREPVARSWCNLAANQRRPCCPSVNSHSPVGLVSRQWDAVDWPCLLCDRHSHKSPTFQRRF